ncbi:hypothetical protein [Nocardia sp. NPDC051570]|uniref:hypothetical protein n=1 Tax=Nocardia sp. NPDC051570 TaxID=3364324 RepID=UPI0037A0BD6B
MTELLAVLALGVSVTWGATISPYRRFSWAMYSHSNRAFLWIIESDRPRPARPIDLGLTPDSHPLTAADLVRLLARTRPAHPIEGLIIGRAGNHFVRYDPLRLRLTKADLPAGTELDCLADTLRRLTCPRSH